MGLDCRIVAVPKHPKNHAIGYRGVSPFLEDDYFKELPDAWSTEPSYKVFNEDVYYCRKNWYLFDFVAQHYAKALKAYSLDSNGCYLLLTRDIIEEYINKLKEDGTKGFHEKTDDIYTLYNIELNRMIRLKAVMEMYEEFLDFYFEGDY